MLTKEKILKIAKKEGQIRTSDFVEEYGVSRQYISSLLNDLVDDTQLIRIGSARNTFYVLPKYLEANPEILPTSFSKRIKKTKKLEEHKILVEVQEKFLRISRLNENIQSIFNFAFSEMLNNAIEHSESKDISFEVSVDDGELSFTINDGGIGVFKNVMKKKKLKSELEAIQDILKGKTTTIPKSHTGQGIFFTSKASDLFMLDSFGHRMIVNNISNNIHARRTELIKRGTRVIFTIKINSKKHLSEVFKEYTNLTEESDYGFDKTDIRVNLYTTGDILVSRSQARRILHGLDNFSIVLFDFDKVPMIGQAFADEIYRVFHNKYPNIDLQETNMNDSVKFMIERAKTDASRLNK